MRCDVRDADRSARTLSTASNVNALILNLLKSDVKVVSLLDAKAGLLVVLLELLAREHLHELDELDAVLEVGLEVLNLHVAARGQETEVAPVHEGL